MDLKGKTIAVTGATGFLGAYIVDDLLSVGATVKAVVRNPGKAGFLADKGVQIAQADLEDPPALAQAFLGVDAVIANAALYTFDRLPWAEFERANRVGTENVFDAAAGVGVRRIAYVSTCGVYRPSLRNLSEDAPRLKARDRFWFPVYYPVSKAVAEEVAWEKARQYGMSLTVLRPAGIWGQRDQQAVPKFRAVMGLPVAPAPTARLPFSHGADVARGIVASLQNDAAIGKAYNLSNEPVSVRKILKTWRDVAGTGPILVPWLVPFTMRYDNSAARRDLGFSNRPLVDSIRDILSE